MACPVQAAEPRAPKPKLIDGVPPKLDFGGGLVIPMDRTIFKTLWEGPDIWITYGRAVAQSELRAMGQAERAAEATMKLMLLTLAFAPERLVRAEGGGWRTASGDARELLVGSIDLPGRPVLPTIDRFGDAGNSNGDPMVHAVTGYMILKSELKLEDVRRIGKVRGTEAPSA